MKETEILLVTDNNVDTVGGEQESIKVILKTLNERYQFALIEPGEVKSRIKNIQYYNKTEKNRLKFLIKNPVQFIRYYISLFLVIRKRQPNIIHTQSQVSFVLVTFLRKLRLINRQIKLVHTDRGLYIGYNRIIQTLFLFLIRELDTLVTTTEFNLNYWQEANIKVSGNELEYKVIANTAGMIFEEYNAKLESSADGLFTVGFSGRYSDQKDWPLAVEIIKELDNRIGKKLRVKIAMGVLDKQAGSETAAMFTELTELLGNRFEGSINITLEEMNHFYYDLDLFIMTSKPNTESFGRTLVEAMSRKTAVLTTNAGGSEEVVRDKANVCYNLNELIDKTMDLYARPEKLMHEKISNLKHVRKTYSLENNIQNHIELYDELLKEKSREGVSYDLTYNSRV